MSVKTRLTTMVMLVTVFVDCADRDRMYGETCGGEYTDHWRCDRDIPEMYCQLREENPNTCTLSEDPTLCEHPYPSPSDPTDSICVKCRKKKYSPATEECRMFVLTQKVGRRRKQQIFTHNMTSYNPSDNNTWPCEGCFKHRHRNQSICVYVYQKQVERRYRSGFITLELRFGTNGQIIPPTTTTTTRVTSTTILTTTIAPEANNLSAINKENAEPVGLLSRVSQSIIEHYFIVTGVFLTVWISIGAGYLFVNRRRLIDANIYDDDPEHDQMNDIRVEQNRGDINIEPKAASSKQRTTKGKTPKDASEQGRNVPNKGSSQAVDKRSSQAVGKNPSTVASNGTTVKGKTSRDTPTKGPWPASSNASRGGVSRKVLGNVANQSSRIAPRDVSNRRPRPITGNAMRNERRKVRNAKRPYADEDDDTDTDTTDTESDYNSSSRSSSESQVDDDN